ncbi:MAG: hypothetical protein DRQ48_07430 [Gammaproteobacteria bacterium]|nr:MAG: hypothetical protein DRQ48_07430 [Gammaproteobacteria bacterium]
MARGYQHDFSDKGTAMFDEEGREKKARTMVAVLQDYFEDSLTNFTVLNVGGSAGIIDDYLSRHFKSVVSIDIDEKAVSHAKNNFSNENLKFEIGDAMNLQYIDETFDVVIATQIYEHVPDAQTMIKEIHRVLKPGGACYFAAGNRLMWNEPHYNLPLLSVVPRPMANLYLRLSGKGNYYYEKHLSYWGLKKLTRSFTIHDYTKALIDNPAKFGVEYMIRPESAKARVASVLARYFMWIVPGYIWILGKNESS